MGSFNDLPKDVIWLIFKEVTIDFLAQHYKAIFSLYDHFLLPDGHISTRMWWLGTKMQTLSLISRAYLTTIRSKCHRKYSDLWSLKPGAWTTEDITRVYRRYSQMHCTTTSDEEGNVFFNVLPRG